MMKYIINKLMLILIISVTFLGAQNVVNLEKRLSKLNDEKTRVSNKLIQQKNELDDQVVLINELKKNKSENEGRLRREMSKSKTISEKIKEIESQLNNLEQDIIGLEHQLHKNYSLLIDSLQNTGKDLSDDELNIYYFRRLELSPKIKSFSFDPQTINEADLRSTDSLEQSIVRNYLELAISEIDSHLYIIQEAEDEIAQQLSFARKTERFLDDIGDNPGFGISQTDDTGSPTLEADYNRGTNDWGETFTSNSKSLNDMIIQISPFLSITGESGHITGTEITSLDEYLNLMQQTQDFLKLYRKSISDKLNRH